MSESANTCLGCEAPNNTLPSGNCRNHGTPQAVTIEIGGTADGGMYITARGDLLKNIWESDG